MQFRVLGPLSVQGPAGPLDLGGRRQRSVLARLLLAGGQVVSVDRLLEDLWSGEPPPRAVGSLQAFISNLRRILEPDRAPRTAATLLVSAPPGYAARVDPAAIDAVRFERLLADGDRALAEGRPTAAMSALDEAMALWRGEPYADFADDAWASPEATRLSELRLVAREHRLAAALAAGSAPAVVPELEVLAAEHPMRESLGRLRALALYRTGRQADALAVLRDVRDRLVDELGIDPGPALQQLEAQVLAQAPELDWVPPREVAAQAPPDGRAPRADDEPAKEATSGGSEPRAGGSEPGTPPTSRRVPGPRKSDDPASGGGAGAGPVGRESALRILRTEADLAAGGPAGVRVALVAGEPGMGKTYLVEALARMLAVDGWQTVWGRCPDAVGVPALWPWHQVLRPLVAEHRPAPELAGALDNLLGEQVPDVSGPGREPPADAAEARFRQHDAVARHLTSVTIEKPLLVVLDDLQWADSSSLRLLLDLVGLHRGGRLLVVATVRAGEIGPALEDGLGRLAALGAVRLDLPGLSDAAVARLADETGLSLTPEEVRRLVERTAGNPFFVRETLKLALSEGRAASLVTVAPTVQDALRRRLARLPAESGRLLAAAAVLGRNVDPDLLVEISGAGEETVLDTLDGAVVGGVLIESRSGRLRFAHDLIRETASAALPPLRRARLHARAADALQQAGADPAAIAFHALAAGPASADLALRASEAAAQAATRRLAFDDAVRWLSSAVDVLADQLAERAAADPVRLVELRLALVRAQLDAGEWVAARRTRADALRATDGVDDLDLSIRALVALDAPTIWTLHDYAEIDLDIVGRVERALAALPPGDSEARCRLLSTLAAELYDGSDNPRCENLSAEGVAMARRLGDPRLLVTALTSRYHAIHMPRLADEILAVAGEMVELGRRHAMPAAELLGHQARAMFLLLRFEIRAADEAAKACLPLLARLQLPPVVAVQHTWDACRLLVDGRVSEAVRAYRAVFVEQRALGFFGTDGLAAVIYAYLSAMTGRWDRVEEQLPALTVVSPYFATTVRIWLMAATGRVEEARALAETDDAPLLHDWAELGALAPRAEAVIAAGSKAAAVRVYDQLLPYSGYLAASGNAFCMGPVDHYLGRLASFLGRGEAAHQHLTAAVAACRREGLTWRADQSAALLPRIPVG